MKYGLIFMLGMLTFLTLRPAWTQSQLVELHLMGGYADSASIVAGEHVTFGLVIQNLASDTIISSHCSFVLYSPDGASWIPWLSVDTTLCFPPPGCTSFDTTYYGEWVGPTSLPGRTWGPGGSDALFDFGIFVNWRSDHDSNPLTPPLLGMGRDTITFGGLASDASHGIPGVFSEVVWLMRLDSISTVSIGQTICVDSINTPPVSPTDWVWNTTSGVVSPGWSGTRCFQIVADCCEGFRGNINLDIQSTIDISDLTFLVGWMFKSGSAQPCLLEADVDGNGDHDIADVTYLVAYMFKGGVAPAGCP